METWRRDAVQKVAQLEFKAPSLLVCSVTPQLATRVRLRLVDATPPDAH
jgi:hypothetical protein